jgi:uncharacterized RDD family membrane protein YckC
MNSRRDRSAQRGQITGLYAGPLTRLLAFAADSAVIVTVYGMVSVVVGFAARSVLGVEVNLSEPGGGGWPVAYAVWAFLYMSISLIITGRTLGKWLTGLRVVERNGSPLTPRTALIRVIALPFTFATLGIGFVGILIGRRRRALHDVLAGSVVVYDWGDRPAEISAPMTRFLARSGALVDPPPQPDTDTQVDPPPQPDTDTQVDPPPQPDTDTGAPVDS